MSAQTIMENPEGLLSAGFNIKNNETRKCYVELLICLHNKINEYEKLLEIATYQFAKGVFDNNKEFKHNIEASILENKAKLLILREVVQIITKMAQKG